MDNVCALYQSLIPLLTNFLRVKVGGKGANMETLTCSSFSAISFSAAAPDFFRLTLIYAMFSEYYIQ